VIPIAEKYTTEKVNAVYDGDVFTITNLTPIHKDDRPEKKRQIEKSLYAVFSKYFNPKNKR